MSTEASSTRNPSVLASATRKPTARSVRTPLWFAFLSAALFGACGAAPESFEDEGGEDVASATDELRRVDDLSNLGEEEIAMEPAEPMVERMDSKHALAYTACTDNCSELFEYGSERHAACVGFCQCVYDNNGKDLIKCTMEFTDTLARL